MTTPSPEAISLAENIWNFADIKHISDFRTVIAPKIQAAFDARDAAKDAEIKLMRDAAAVVDRYTAKLQKIVRVSDALISKVGTIINEEVLLDEEIRSLIPEVNSYKAIIAAAPKQE